MEKLNQWLTLLANLGVLVGIVFIIIEIQQNTAMMRSEIYQARSDTSIQYSLSRADSSIYANLTDRVRNNGPLDEAESYAILSINERRQLSDWLIAEVRMYDATLYEYQQGLLDEEFFEGWRKGAASRGPVWLAFWGDNSAAFRPSLLEEIKKAIADDT